jgi:DHA1 family bicyclomycin/chloramphenicol resistance-like MFS transporter
VLQQHFGLTQTQFSLAFAANAIGIMANGRISARRVERVGPGRLLTAGVLQSLTGGVGVLICMLAHAPLAPVLISLFVMVSAIGLVFPNATALAMDRHPDIAGSASGLLGLAQFAIGALVAPLVGGGTLAFGVVIAAMSALAVVARLLSAAA